ncbi:hypothetical protein Bca4012_009882 [Brassica carinata]|uniref:GHMP kinase C-terminal domain-containing protein n=1 Tax=Brassica carinata TaxID=52824 RepID=A0A8X7V2E4_BRACI|nr:hypothetical protein Bca52824_035108 [Brassica carinata]
MKVLKKAALEVEAFGCTISGAGPTSVAVIDMAENGEEIGRKIVFNCTASYLIVLCFVSEQKNNLNAKNKEDSGGEKKVGSVTDSPSF